MNPIYLHHFFDIDRWTYCLFEAFFKVRSEWSWRELNSQFLTVCLELKAPRYSASRTARMMDNFRVSGYVTAEKNGDDIILRVKDLDLTRVRKSLVRAISWATCRAKVKEDCWQYRHKLLAEAEADPSRLESVELRIRINKKSEAKTLQALDREFRLSPNRRTTEAK